MISSLTAFQQLNQKQMKHHYANPTKGGTMDKIRQSIERDKRQESLATRLFRDALGFAGHGIGCDEEGRCKCGYEELCLALARSQSSLSPPSPDAIYLLRESIQEIAGHEGGQCEDRRCRCGAKKAFRKLGMKSPDTDNSVAWWCSKCVKSHCIEDLNYFWDSKDLLTVPIDSTVEELKESNRKKCEIGNCPTENCPGPVRRSILSIRRTIPDVPF